MTRITFMTCTTFNSILDRVRFAYKVLTLLKVRKRYFRAMRDQKIFSIADIILNNSSSFRKEIKGIWYDLLEKKSLETLYDYEQFALNLIDVIKWHETNEGHEFWNRVSKKAGELESEDWEEIL